ncbi:hypothetical protein GBA52_022499 [Prunus armeniaca]|nr:hypothetical protein GBA52_022499 [Prunus armeniaca]
MNLELEQQHQPNSKSSPEGEGEGADDQGSNLKMTSWAALERLPTRSRIRRGILVSHDQQEQRGQNREIDVAVLKGQETNVVTDLILKVLGLEACADTVVGDEMTRGISGGQKKRVTTGRAIIEIVIPNPECLTG